MPPPARSLGFPRLPAHRPAPADRLHPPFLCSFSFQVFACRSLHSQRRTRIIAIIAFAFPACQVACGCTHISSGGACQLSAVGRSRHGAADFSQKSLKLQRGTRCLFDLTCVCDMSTDNKNSSKSVRQYLIPCRSPVTRDWRSEGEFNRHSEISDLLQLHECWCS